MIDSLVAADRDRCRVTVCRGCCCGDPGRHADVDHAQQFDRLMRGLRHSAEVRVSTCLLVCGESNVLVVSPSPAARLQHGARPVWIGRVLDESIVDLVIKWVAAGGPGDATLPDGLLPYVTEPFGALIP